MIDIRYFLARQKTAQEPAAGSPHQKEAAASSPARQVIPAWAGLRYLGLPDEPLPEETEFRSHQAELS